MPTTTEEHAGGDDADATRHVTECPIDGCEAVFLGVTYDDAVDHVLGEHADRVHPHWIHTSRSPEEALHMLAHEAREPRAVESPGTELNPRITAFLDDYLVYILLAVIFLVLGWPLIIDLLFA